MFPYPLIIYYYECKDNEKLNKKHTWKIGIYGRNVVFLLIIK